ncbi:MAG: ATP-binding cassette domain-containing protein [Clostridiales Family XIII bacterium]|jgi:molybdate transport system ATP-binding protein|nr:ATP-binding cassette domain-containing protein [Clostridiales Family XIII bacterium]
MKNIYFKVAKKLEHFLLDVEYAFDEGVLVIQGESGAGKTTLLNCIAGLMAPDEGLIAIGGETMFSGGAERDGGAPRIGVDRPARARNLGYLFQSYALFPNMTVEQNILYGVRNRPEYRNGTKRGELVDYANYIMDTFGIGHLRRKHPRMISGGEKQRVALSRAIVTKPGLLLLDEPFSALDDETRNVVYGEFQQFREKFRIPAILITHDARESEMFGDHKLRMKSGKLV